LTGFYTGGLSSISVDTPSEDEPESEDDESNPYPLEGKFIDEADRHKYDYCAIITPEHTLIVML
jgi:RNA polymerase-associated protein RTF1